MDRPDLGDDVDQMTAYCTYCPKLCRFSCPTADAESRETVTPWGMMRLLELAKDGSVPLDAEVAEVFHHCTGCRRCQTYCKHDNDVPRALWKARQWTVRHGFLPDELRALKVRFDNYQRPYASAPARPSDTQIFDDQSPIAFWPDCATVEFRPELVLAIGRLFKVLTGDALRLIQPETGPTPCCGFPLFAAGLPADDRPPITGSLHVDGVTEIITDCEALAAWGHGDSSWGDDTSRPLAYLSPPVHLLTYLAPLIGENPPATPLDGGDLVMHHSCYMARQLDGVDDVNTILSNICHPLPQTMAYDGEESPCCGGRHHYRALAPESAQKASQKVAGQLEHHPEARRMVTTASHCQNALASTSDDDKISTLIDLICSAYGCHPDQI